MKDDFEDKLDKLAAQLGLRAFHCKKLQGVYIVNLDSNRWITVGYPAAWAIINGERSLTDVHQIKDIL